MFYRPDVTRHLPKAGLAAALSLLLLGALIPAAPAAATPRFARLLGLGDSVPTGATCACPDEVALLGLRLGTAQGSPVAVTNAAHNGATARDVLVQVRGGGLGSPAARVTTVTVGANDFDPTVVATAACGQAACYRTPLHVLDGLIRAVVSALLVAQRGQSLAASPIVVTGYWNVFRDGAVGRSYGPAYARNSDALTRAANSVLRRAALAYGVRYADLYRPFKGDGDRDDTWLLGSDGDHPNAAGHRVVAATVQRVLAGLA